jgi:hypothetical protein
MSTRTVSKQTKEDIMRRSLVSALTAATAILLTVAVSASGHRSAPRSKTLVVSATSFHTAGTGLGAVTTFTDDLVANGKKLGRDQVTCEATGPGSFLECTATDLLPSGEINSIGPFDPVHQSHVTVGIVGGTRTYRNARGTIDITVISQTKSTYTYHLDS